MKTIDDDTQSARHNRVAFIKNCGLDPAHTTLHTLSYGGIDYCRYVQLDDATKGDGIMRESTIDADAVVVAQPGHAILLPLADCVGAVIHDPHKNILMLSHLGRHNLEQYGGTKCIEYLIDTFDIDPSRLMVWLSPSAGAKNYPLYAFDNRSLNEVAREQLMNAGVLQQSIRLSTIDSSLNCNYYSHSQFLKGNRNNDGRFAIVAVMD